MSATSVKTSLLQTKLYRPPVTEDYVPRLRLCAWLEQIVQRPLTLISAPAGYGKTTLLSACLDKSDIQGAWLSLDENDNDLATFVIYFLAAIQGLHPTFGKEMLSMVEGANLPTSRFLAGMFCNEFDKLDEEIVLVLDDYGLINKEEVHQFLSELLHHPHPHFHLVLLTRHDPPLPLSDWRARHQIVEIRSPELRFTLAEATSFLRQAADPQLDDETIAALNMKTEGWAAGLRLAALSFSSSEEFQGHIDELSGSNMYVMDYLLSQVLARLPAETQSFLIQTSILDRLSAPLCQAVIATENRAAAVQTMLQELETANIFIVPLDELRHWFRYHHLFQQFLQMRLNHDYSTAVIAALHERAGAWYTEHGYIERALHHTLAAGDMETAVQLVAANRQELMNQEQYHRLSRWLQLFPQHVIEGSPDMLLLQARFAQIQRQDMNELSQIVDKVDALVNSLHLEPQKAACYLAENGALRSAQQYYALDPQCSLKSCQNALEILPQAWYALRSYCWIYGAVALQMMGDLSGAYEWINLGRREDMTVRDEPQGAQCGCRRIRLLGGRRSDGPAARW